FANPEHAPSGGTPMGEGIATALTQFTGTVANYQTLVLMSDGASNGGRPVFSALAAPSTIDEAFAIAYGASGGSDVQPEQLRVAVGNDASHVFGVKFNPDNTITFTADTAEGKAHKAFGEIGAHILGFKGKFYPPGVVTSRKPFAVHE